MPNAKQYDPFSWPQVFRRVTYDLDTNELIADHGYLDPAKEAAVQSNLPGGKRNVKTVFHYVDGVDAAHDERQSVDALGRMMTTGPSGDKRLPGTRPDSIPSEAYWRLSPKLQMELKKSQREMNAKKLQFLMIQVSHALTHD